MQLTIQDCFKTRTIEASALHLLNQLLHHPAKAYLNNHGDYWEFGGRLSMNLHCMSKDLKHQTFQFLPYLKRTKRMKNKKVRDLYYPTWPDRIVERWLSECLNRLLNKWFSQHSYAYRSEYCIDVCQWRVLQSITEDSFICRRDISNCFYTIDHDSLLKQLTEIVDPNDYLFRLLVDRIKYEYYTEDNQDIRRSTIGVPFGSSIAPLLANIAMTKIDRAMDALQVKYFRYADDFLVVAQDCTTALQAAQTIDGSFADLKFSSKPSHQQNLTFQDNADGFQTISKFKYLGLEFTRDKQVCLSREKQRKIVNLICREIKHLYLKNVQGVENRLRLCVDAVNKVMTDRIRSVAIIDYYLRHVTDERQLRVVDMIIAKMVISAVLEKPFRYKDFGKISYRSLRAAGLVSLVHRRRLHAHGHLNVRFIDFHNQLVSARFVAMHEKRHARIEHIKLAKKLRKVK